MGDINVWNNFHLQGNEIKEFKLWSLNADPGTGAKYSAMMYYNSTTGKIRRYNANTSAWEDMDAKALSFANAGTGIGVYSGMSGDTVQLRGIKGSTFVTVTLTGNDVVVSIPVDNTSSVDSSNSDVKLVTTAAAKRLISDAVTEGLTGFCEYVGTFDATKSVRVNIPGAIKKGQFWRVSVSGANSGITSPSNADGQLNVGDMLIASQNMAAGAEPGGANTWSNYFDVIDNTEAPDIVRLDAIQTLKNKTIDTADGNTVNGLNGNNFNPDDILTSSDIETFISNRSLNTSKVVGEGLIITLLRSVIRSYSQSISGTSGSISKTTHKLGAVTNVTILDSTGSIAMVDVVINPTTQNITWTTSQSFSGQIIISGKGI